MAAAILPATTFFPGRLFLPSNICDWSILLTYSTRDFWSSLIGHFNDKLSKMCTPRYIVPPTLYSPPPVCTPLYIHTSGSPFSAHYFCPSTLPKKIQTYSHCMSWQVYYPLHRTITISIKANMVL